MKSKWLVLFTLGMFFLCANVFADKPAPSWNGKPFDKMTSQEMRDANKALDAQIKKGDSSAVQQKADLNNAFEKTPEGQKMKDEDQLAKDKDDLAILEKQEGANGEREVQFINDESALKGDGSYWDPPNHWPSPPDGKIGPGGDRDKRDAKLKKDAEKARKAKEEARKKIEDLKKKIKDIEDRLYVKTKDIRGEIGPDSDPLGKSTGRTQGSLDTFEKFQIPTVVTSNQSGGGAANASAAQRKAPSVPRCPVPDR